MPSSTSLSHEYSGVSLLLKVSSTLYLFLSSAHAMSSFNPMSQLHDGMDLFNTLSTMLKPRRHDPSIVYWKRLEHLVPHGAFPPSCSGICALLMCFFLFSFQRAIVVSNGRSPPHFLGMKHQNRDKAFIEIQIIASINIKDFNKSTFQSFESNPLGCITSQRPLVKDQGVALQGKTTKQHLLSLSQFSCPQLRCLGA